MFGPVAATTLLSLVSVIRARRGRQRPRGISTGAAAPRVLVRERLSMALEKQAPQKEERSGGANPPDRPIHRLLAANRSEIAIRIFRAANELNLQTIGIYSQEDRLSLHRFKADEAYEIGMGKGPVEAYLDIPGIVGLAKEKGVDAIHPGYGFLSENPALARACAEAGVTFVGPPAGLLELLGDKTAARRLAASAGVPILPGTETPVRSAEEAVKVAREIGFPLIVKAAMGGGGRGMRVVHQAADLERRLAEAQNEAHSAFGDPSVFLEKIHSPVRGTSRCRSWRITTATWSTCGKARLFRCSGVTRRWSRLRPRRTWRLPFARSYARRRCNSAEKPDTETPAPWSSCTTWTPASGISSK